MEREADAADQEAERLASEALASTLVAGRLASERTLAEQEALVAGSFAFEAMFALALIDAELAAMGGLSASGLDVDLRSTGEETGHLFDAVVTNLGREALTFVLERGLVLLSGSSNHSDMAVTEERRVEVPAGESVTVPVQGCSLEPDKAPPNQTGRGLNTGPSYSSGSVSSAVLGILTATDQVLAEEGVEANQGNRTVVAQWALWRQGGMPSDRMTVEAFMGVAQFLGLFESGDLGGLLGGLLGGGRSQAQAKTLMGAVEEVVARTGEG